MMRSTTTRTSRILGDGLSVSTLNRLEFFAILPFVVGQQKLPVLFDKRDDGWKDISLELLIFG
jgi:hypothetical protein